jgi:hypothetical protein
MPVKVDKLIMIAGLTICIVFLMFYGWQMCTCIEKDAKEGFTNPTSDSSAPTRASDCRCLPGYIPSNIPVAKRLGFENQLIEVKTPMNVKYGSGNNWVKKYVIATFRATNSFFGRDPLPGVRKQVEVDSTPLEYYFCQSLSDSQTTKKCY